MARSQHFPMNSPTARNASSTPSSSSAGAGSPNKSHRDKVTILSSDDVAQYLDQSIGDGKSLRSSVWKYAKKITPDLARCNECGKEIKTKCGGTSSLRKHLINRHHITVSSSKKPEDRTRNNSISKQRKSRLDHLLKLAIFEDGRTFGDFSKSGMVKFLAEAVPGKTFTKPRWLFTNNFVDALSMMALGWGSES